MFLVQPVGRETKQNKGKSTGPNQKSQVPGLPLTSCEDVKEVIGVSSFSIYEIGPKIKDEDLLKCSKDTDLLCQKCY